MPRGNIPGADNVALSRRIRYSVGIFLGYLLISDVLLNQKLLTDHSPNGCVVPLICPC